MGMAIHRAGTFLVFTIGLTALVLHTITAARATVGFATAGVAIVRGTVIGIFLFLGVATSAFVV